MQLAQYAATVANDGSGESFMSSKESMTIMISGLGQLKIDRAALNQVHISAEDMALIKQGFTKYNGTSG